MHYSFQLDPIVLRGVTALVERPSLDANGGLGSGFLANAEGFRSHPDIGFEDALSRVLADDGVDFVVISRNSRLVLDDSLRERIAGSFDDLRAYDGEWALATSGGLGLRKERFCRLYSSVTPFLMLAREIRPIVDTMLELYILDAAFARTYFANQVAPTSAFLELGIILSGYEAGRLSLFVPKLAAGVDGPFRPRDLMVLSTEAAAFLAGASKRAVIETLAGAIVVEPVVATHPAGHVPPRDRLSPQSRRDTDEAIERTVDRYLPVLSLSIVTRTRFTRPHLLRRLLTSVTRAMIGPADVEVVLSTDIGRDQAEAELAILQSDFRKLSIGLAVNKTHRFSRVDNMIGGMRAATKEYVWLVDDDDYVDTFAFQLLRRSLFGTGRPVLMADSQAHNETWNLSSPNFPVLARSQPGPHWPASGWRYLFGGVNQLPICNVITPRDFMMRCLDRFEFRYDLSEDYTLFLLLLTSPDLPEIVELTEVVAHISIREIGENSVTVEDKSGWTRDITGFLFDLMQGSEQSGRGVWSVVASGPGVGYFNGLVPQQPNPSQQEIAVRDRQIASLTQQLSTLQCLLASKLEQS